MTSENFFPALFALWLVYWIIRFVLFELLTITLRRIPVARAWLQRQVEQGRFNRRVRSPELFRDALRLLGRAVQWVTGRGWLRAPTFIFVAGIMIFLTSLPMDQAGTARAEYEASLNVLKSGDSAEVAQRFCMLENAMAEAGLRTGLSLAPPPELKAYPFDETTLSTLRELRGDRLLFMTQALLAGRKLTDDPADVDPLVRSFPNLERALQTRIVDGRLVNDGYHFAPPDDASEAARQDIIAICDDDPMTSSRLLKPVRDPKTYVELAEKFRTRSLAFLTDHSVREAFDTYQLHVASSRFGVSFLLSVATAIVLWASLKLMIVASMAPRRSIWLVANYALILLMSGIGVIGFSATLSGTRAIVNTMAPLASGYLIASAGDPASEAEHQRQMNAMIGKAVELVELTCADVGGASPFTGWCQTADLLKEPWDDVDQRFDFERIVPPYGGTDALTAHFMSRLSRSPMTFGIAFQGVDEETQDRFDISVWQGVRMGSFMFIVLAPWLLLLAVATLLAPLLELRWTVVKRIDRIVRERTRVN